MRTLLACLLLAVPGPLWAKNWTVDPAKSEILFTYERAEQPAEGRFDRFQGEGFIDLDNLEDTRLWIRIESSSIDLNERLASAFATSAEWFDSKNHPLIVFELIAITRDDETSFSAQGDLTIRGKTERVMVPIELTFVDGQARAKGDIRLKRSDYLIGVGPSAAFVTIGPDVSVYFDLTATPVE
ncbi:MAG: YceI family protein [Pseudomonadota bacterium]